MYLCFKHFVSSKLLLIITILIIIATGLSCHYYHAYIKEFITGSSIIIAALLTAWSSLDQFYKKQLALRFQKFYFEDTLHQLAKSIDSIMQCSKNNMLLVESLINKASNIGELKIEIEQKKSALIEVFKETNIKFETIPSSSTFALHTLQCLLLTSNPSSLSTWIKELEDDSKRFANFLQGQLSKIENLLVKLDNKNLNEFNNYIKNGLNNNIRLSYTLIDRHNIVFNWLSIITFHFFSADFRSKDKILEFWKSSFINKILNLITLAYKDLSIASSELEFSAITNELGEKLKTTIAFQYKKIAEFQIKHKSV